MWPFKKKKQEPGYRILKTVTRLSTKYEVQEYDRYDLRMYFTIKGGVFTDEQNAKNFLLKIKADEYNNQIIEQQVL